MLKRIVPIVLMSASLVLLTSCSSGTVETTPAPSASESSMSTASPAPSDSMETGEEATEEATEAPAAPAPTINLSEADSTACDSYASALVTLQTTQPEVVTDFTSVDAFINAANETKAIAGITPELSTSLDNVSITTTAFKDFIISQEANPETTTEDQVNTAGEAFSNALSAMNKVCGY